MRSTALRILRSLTLATSLTALCWGCGMARERNGPAAKTLWRADGTSAEVWTPAVCPGTDWLAFFLVEDDPRSGGRYDVCVMHASRRNRIVWRQSQAGRAPCWMPEGTALLLCSGERVFSIDRGQGPGLRLEGGHEVLAEFPSGKFHSVVFTPDRTSLVATANVQGIVNLYKVELATHDVRPITTFHSRNDCVDFLDRAAFLPSGDGIVFPRFTRNADGSDAGPASTARLTLWSVDAETGEMKELTQGTADGFPLLWREQDAIAFVRARLTSNVGPLLGSPADLFLYRPGVVEECALRDVPYGWFDILHDGRVVFAREDQLCVSRPPARAANR